MAMWVWSGRRGPTHHCSRHNGSDLGFDLLSEQNHRRVDRPHERQHHHHCLPEEAGGYHLESVVQPGVISDSVDRGPLVSFVSKVHPWDEHSGRSVLPTEWSRLSWFFDVVCEVFG